MEETIRLATLHSYGILDTPPEPAFDAIAQDAARIFDCQMAVVSFIDGDRQWYKARAGVTGDGVARSASLCRHVIADDAVVAVGDARLDARFRGSPFVLGPPHVRFYAAAPIKALNRARLGTICVFDPMPRDTITPRECRMLSALAARTVELLEHRRWGGTGAQARAG